MTSAMRLYAASSLFALLAGLAVGAVGQLDSTGYQYLCLKSW